MNHDLFYAHITYKNLHYIHQWVGDNLKINYVANISDLSELCKKIILIDIRDANFQIDLIKKLVEQKNYFVFFEAWACNKANQQLTDLVADLPANTPFAVIANTDDQRSNGPCVNLRAFYFITMSMPNRLRSEHLIEHIFDPVPKPFTFSYLNGRSRPHRKHLWHLLNQQGSLDRSLWSWWDDSSATNSLSAETNDTIPRQSLDSKYESAFVDIGHSMLQQYDAKRYYEFRIHLNQGHWIDGHIVPEMYKNTYFSVVTESVTEFSPFLTEKIFKPLLAGHPFIVLGSAGYYQKLKELGFQTFDTVIDESFDLEQDVVKRCAMIAAQVDRLCNINLAEFHVKVRDICEHNRQHYINNQWSEWLKVHNELNEFFNQVITEHNKNL